tara:strand:+ start:252 stop:431 length:180 start_codon:yes stop_codon:yes gene_type:complete
MNQYNAITEEQKAEIRLYYFIKGYGQRSTAYHVGVSRNTVKKVINAAPPRTWAKYWGQI